jgi:hypothetical protein
MYVTRAVWSRVMYVTPAVWRRDIYVTGWCVSGEQSLEHGSLFAQLNSACAADVLCIVVEAGVQCACPLHVLALSRSVCSLNVQIFTQRSLNVP